MRNFTFWLLLLGTLSGLSAQAQEVTIAEARAQAPTTNATVGVTVTVRGVVTNGAELGTIRYFQDKTAGIAAYGAGTGTAPAVTAALNAVVPGDSILVTGQLKQFYGLLEIDPITSVTVLAGNKTVKPVEFPAGNFTAAFAEQYESRLVRINGISSINDKNGAAVTSFQSVSSGYRINNNAATPVYINANSTGPTGLVGKPAPSGLYDAVGLISQHMTANTGTVNTTAGYQLLPRLYADFLQGNTPNIIQSPIPVNISTTGLTVTFNTQNDGSTQVIYGTSPTALTSTAGATSLDGKTHSLALTGLTPATVYYVQAISNNTTGHSESRVTPMVTASLSSGRIRNYFNNSVDNTLASAADNKAIYLPQGHIADTLAAYINKAQQTVDITIYNWNNATILAAVNAAQARGVLVRVIYEDDNSNFSINGLNAAIGRVFRPAQTGGTTQTSSIMHNKFVVIDANSTDPNRPWVWTGSTNWTPAQLATDRNNVINIQDQSLARVYTIEFEEMWGGKGPQPGTSLFGSRKTDNTPHYLNIGGKLVESWFSPSDNVNGHLIEAIQTADNDMHIESMLITQTTIGNAIKNQIVKKNISGCSELLTNSIAPPSDIVYNNIMATPGMEQRTFIDATSGIMHHKTLIVDAGAPDSDPLVFVGSHNWTLSADTENDENTLIVHDAKIVNRYYQEFAARIAAQNRAGIVVCRFNLGTVTATRTATVQASSLHVYPNPAAGSFRVAMAATGTSRTAAVVLRDATGRVVLTQTCPLIGQELSIDASSLKAGLYLLQVSTPGTTQVGRVVVE